MPSVRVHVSFYKYTLSGTFPALLKSVVCFPGRLSPDVGLRASCRGCCPSDARGRLSVIKGPFCGLGSDRFGQSWTLECCPLQSRLPSDEGLDRPGKDLSSGRRHAHIVLSTTWAKPPEGVQYPGPALGSLPACMEWGRGVILSRWVGKGSHLKEQWVTLTEGMPPACGDPAGTWSPGLTLPPALRPVGASLATGSSRAGELLMRVTLGGTLEGGVTPAACLSAAWSPSCHPLSRAPGLGSVWLVSYFLRCWA